jgi:hypothetical protein
MGGLGERRHEEKKKEKILLGLETHGMAAWWNRNENKIRRVRTKINL